VRNFVGGYLNELPQSGSSFFLGTISERPLEGL
jgi:hypothetical protein